MASRLSKKIWSDEVLDQARLKGDVRADQALADIIGAWPEFKTAKKKGNSTSDAIRKKLDLIERMMELIKPVQTNDDLKSSWSHDHLKRQKENLGDQAFEGLLHFLNETQHLPEWADLEQIKRAEAIFEESGVLSCVLFFCSSLPEVYVIPDVSTVLHATGNLERITAQRIRATAIMILSVMLPGGLYSKKGGGRPQVLKARFIHSVIRNLILRSNPSDLVEKARANNTTPLVDALLMTHPPRGMLEMTLAHGWDPNSSGVPINQEEMAYTLLTFSYVYLRSLRRLG